MALNRIREGDDDTYTNIGLSPIRLLFVYETKSLLIYFSLLLWHNLRKMLI